MPSPVPRKTLLSVAALCFALKALLLFAALPAFEGALPQAYEADEFADGYDLIAMNLMEGRGYRVFPETSETIIRTPGFVLVLAGIFALFGKSLTAVKVFQLLLSSLTGWLTYRLGGRVAASHAVGAAAALLYYFHPGTIVADSRGGIETLFTFTLVVFMCLLYRALERQGVLAFVVAGLVFGAMLLVKSSAGLFPAFLFVYLLRGRRWREAVRYAFVRVAALSAAASLVLLPWIVRNYLLVGKFIPTMTVGGLVAFQGLYVVEHKGERQQHFQLLDRAAREQERIAQELGLKHRRAFFPQFYTAEDETFYYGHLGGIVMARFRESPALLARVALHNAWAFWFQGRNVRATLINTALVVPLLALVAAGLVLAYREKRRVTPLVLFVVSFVAAHLFMIAVARFYVPIIPLLAIPAAIAALRVVGHGLRGRTREARIAGIAPGAPGSALV
jgi:4-amino-4-deoxy-L-arabinose transferase-like glycosyltransferase